MERSEIREGGHRAERDAPRFGAGVLGGAECAGAEDKVWGVKDVVYEFCIAIV